MTTPHNREELLIRLLHVSEEALKAARIDHRAALDSALDERGAVLAELFGFDPNEGLPPFSGELSANRLKRVSGVDPGTVNKLKTIDQRLLQALEATRQRLKKDERTLDRGRRVMARLREMNTLRTSRRFDRTG